MATTTIPSACTIGRRAPDAARETRTVLACTAGDVASESVLRAAARIASANARPAHALAVVEPLPIGFTGLEVIAPPSHLEEERRAAVLGIVRQRLLSTLGPRAVWGVEVTSGQPARMIARRAREQGASLIVLGLGRHAIVDRLLGTETALQTMRVAATPVLAVPAGDARPMRHAVVGMDFSASAIHAARTALDCLERPSLLTLIHVIPRMDAPPFIADDWNAAYARELPARFERALEAIGAPDEVIVKTVTLRGDPAVELLAYAQHQDVDLVALGRRGLGAFERLIVGSVATRVVRGATCAVLTAATPPGAEADEIERRLTRLLESDRPQEWPARLAELTRRNAGRTTHLEVDDPELGAQSQETGYVLRGLAYDRHDGRVEIMLGADGADGPHLTRGIAGVERISVANDERGRDRTIRLAHGRGQTLLTFAE